MLERSEGVLRIVCLALGAVLLAQVARIAVHRDPLGTIVIPSVPTWTAPKPDATGSTPPSPPHAGPPPAPRGPAGMMPGFRGPGMAAPGPGLPSEQQRRVDRIVQSGLLGPIIRPPPMALIGIAGDRVLFRAPNGQTGLIKEGEELGGVRLVRIGTNRVLVVEDGQEKELSVFGGFGGESLLLKTNVDHP